MKKEAKSVVVSEIKKKVSDANVAILLDFSGMKVKEVSDLKKRLRKEGAELTVVKNTLLKKAIDEKKLPEFSVLLNGPTALLLGNKDSLAPLKVLVKYASETGKPKIKGGLFEGRFSSLADFTVLSKVPGKKELITKAVMGIKSPLFGLAFTLSGTLKKLLYALEAVKDKKSKGEGGETK